MGGLVQINPPAASWVHPEYIVGRRYYAFLGGIIATSGMGPNYFPGTVAGVADATTCGVYV
jgi:hypothetical protein